MTPAFAAPRAGAPAEQSCGKAEIRGTLLSKPPEPTHRADPPRKPESRRDPAAGEVGTDPQAEAFRTFLTSLWPEAQRRGISRETFAAALDGLKPDPTVTAATREQTEFARPIWSYLAGAVSAARIERGRRLAEQWRAVLDRVQAHDGVPAEILLGIWGLETNFGSHCGDKPIVRSLATLAHIGDNGPRFTDELLAALAMLQKLRLAPTAIQGSWAGATGHPQFLPSVYLQYAVSYERGRQAPDIWTSVPDALASIANYLRSLGWQPDLPWGFEVVVPADFDYAALRHGFPEWQALGFRRPDAEPWPGRGEATLFQPSGARGPAFLITDNFAVIKRYNMADAYALAVGHLGDRIAGRNGIAGAWPVGDAQLDRAESAAVQRLLKALGFYEGAVDGRIGPATREAVHRFQRRAGLTPADGHPTPALLRALRDAAGEPAP